MINSYGFFHRLFKIKKLYQLTQIDVFNLRFLIFGPNLGTYAFFNAFNYVLSRSTTFTYAILVKFI